MNKNIEKLDGRTACIPDNHCDICPLQQTECVKIDVDGIGRMCLIENKT